MRNDALRASNGVANSCEAIHAVRQFILARPEREGGPRKRWEGYLCFFIHTCCGYNGEVVAFSPLCLISLSLVLRSCRYGTSFVRSDKGCKALFFCGHNSSFSEYTYSPPPSTSLGSAQQSSFARQSDVRNILLFRQVIPALRPLIPQRGRLYKHKYFT